MSDLITPSTSNAIKTLVLLQDEEASGRRGQGYIENTTDAYRFTGHLLWVLTGGKEGEERPCLTARLNKLL